MFLSKTTAQDAPVIITVTSDKTSYIFGDLVNISGFLTYNGAPVAYKLVTVSLLDPVGNVINLRVSETDLNGSYNCVCRTSSDFSVGNYKILASVDVAQVTYTTTNFFLLEAPTLTISPPSQSIGINGNVTYLTNSNTVSNLTISNYQTLLTNGISCSASMLNLSPNTPSLLSITTDNRTLGLLSSAQNNSTTVTIDVVASFELLTLSQNLSLTIMQNVSSLNLTTSQECSMTSTGIFGGTLWTDKTEIAGIGLSIINSSASEGTEVTITSGSYGNTPLGSKCELPIVGANYYNVIVTSSSPLGLNAMATVYISNPDFSNKSVMSFWDNTTWVPLFTSLASPDTIQAILPIASLLDTPIMAINSSDFTLQNVALKDSIVEGGFSLPINVTIQNLGVYSETAVVQLFANSTQIYNQTVTLNGGQSISLDWLINTEKLPIGNYTITTYVPPQSGQRNSTNTLISGTIGITYLGDLNGDFKVDSNDFFVFMSAYVTYWTTGYVNPAADFNHNSKIDESNFFLFMNAYITYWSYFQVT